MLSSCQGIPEIICSRLLIFALLTSDQARTTRKSRGHEGDRGRRKLPGRTHAGNYFAQNYGRIFRRAWLSVWNFQKLRN